MKKLTILVVTTLCLIAFSESVFANVPSNTNNADEQQRRANIEKILAKAQKEYDIVVAERSGDYGDATQKVQQCAADAFKAFDKNVHLIIFNPQSADQHWAERSQIVDDFRECKAQAIQAAEAAQQQAQQQQQQPSSIGDIIDRLKVEYDIIEQERGHGNPDIQACAGNALRKLNENDDLIINNRPNNSQYWQQREQIINSWRTCKQAAEQRAAQQQQQQAQQHDNPFTPELRAQLGKEYQIIRAERQGRNLRVQRCGQLAFEALNANDDKIIKNPDNNSQYWAERTQIVNNFRQCAANAERQVDPAAVRDQMSQESRDKMRADHQTIITARRNSNSPAVHKCFQNAMQSLIQNDNDIYSSADPAPLWLQRDQIMETFQQCKEAAEAVEAEAEAARQAAEAARQAAEKAKKDAAAAVEQEYQKDLKDHNVYLYHINNYINHENPGVVRCSQDAKAKIAQYAPVRGNIQEDTWKYRNHIYNEWQNCVRGYGVRR